MERRTAAESGTGTELALCSQLCLYLQFDTGGQPENNPFLFYRVVNGVEGVSLRLDEPGPVDTVVVRPNAGVRALHWHAKHTANSAKKHSHNPVTR